ncbi:MAG: Asp-tRNA(Asn)/Glu-tRNA(Gln) amidotransferase subunit GatC [Candidatus Eisenbacteria bacterium]
MLTHKDLDHLCRLARLHLPESERGRLRADLESILGYVESLHELDTRAFEAAKSGDADVGAFREDEARATLTQEEALRNAPAQLDGHFAVPTVLARDAALDARPERDA